MNRSLNTSRTVSAFAVSLMAILPLASQAQTVPALVEGPISAIADDGAGGIWITVVDVSILVPQGVFTSGSATSPTAVLSQAQLLDTAPMPGRSEPGFIGGTAIINGSSTVGGDFVADDLFVEPAENVVLGIITANDNCALSLQGVPLVMVADGRMPAGDAVNAAGFQVDYCQTPVGGAAAIEGYYSGGALYVFAFESDDAPVLSGDGVVTISRAQCSGNRLEVRGSTTAGSGQVTVSDADEGSVFGTTGIVRDAVTGTGTYRFRQNVGACPSNVRVDNLDDGSFASSPVN